MYLEMGVHGFALDAVTRLPMILLKEAGGERLVPLWVNSGDLVIIATELVGRELAGGKEGIDLLGTILGHLEFTPERIALDDRDDGGYQASLVLSHPEGETVMNLSALEALLMALRYTLPVMVSLSLLERLSLPSGIPDREAGGEGERYEDILEKLDPAEMGKYPM